MIPMNLRFIQHYALGLTLLGSALLINPFSSTDIFEFPKLFLLIIAVGFLTIVTIVDFVFQGAPKIKSIPKAFIFLGIFLFGETLAYAFSSDRSISLMGAPFRFQGLLTHIHYVLLLFVTYFFFHRHPREKTKGIFGWLVAALIVSQGAALFPYAISFESESFFLWMHPSFFYDRVYGTFGNPNFLAVFLITTLPFLVLALSKKRHLVMTALFWIFLGITLVTLFLTGSRSAWIAVIMGFLLWGVLKAIKKQGFAMLAVTVLLVVLGIGGIILQQSNPIPSLERLSVKSENLTSLKTRLSLWKAGTQLFLSRPLTGFGQDAIKNNIEPYLPDRLKANDVFYIDRTHSELIDILVTRGFFSFIGYVGFFLTILWKSIRRFALEKSLDEYFSAATIALFTLLLFQSVNFSTITSNILLYFLGGYLLSIVPTKRDIIE